MKYLILILISFLFLHCSLCKKGETYEVISKNVKITDYNKTLVKKVFFSNMVYDLNINHISEEFYEQINVYLDSINYGLIMPQKVEAYINKGSAEEKLDSSYIEIRNTMLGIGLFVNKRFYGDETLLRLVIVPREDSSKKNFMCVQAVFE